MFLQRVNELGHTCRLLRTDCGSENGITAAIQSFFLNSTSAHIYGKSTANQRIEALWSKLRPCLQGWMDFFSQLVIEGSYQPGNVIQTAAMRWVFTKQVNHTLEDFMIYWNTHHIRQSSDSPGGIPDILFYGETHCGAEVNSQKINDARATCTLPGSITGDTDTDVLFNRILTEQNMIEPSDRQEALRLYYLLVNSL